MYIWVKTRSGDSIKSDIITIQDISNDINKNNTILENLEEIGKVLSGLVAELKTFHKNSETTLQIVCCGNPRFIHPDDISYVDLVGLENIRKEYMKYVEELENA